MNVSDKRKVTSNELREDIKNRIRVQMEFQIRK